MSKVIRAPKRRIERFRSTVVDAGVAGTETEKVLHTAEDSKTLIRALGRVKLVGIDSTVTAVNYSMILRVNPRGTSVQGIASSESLDNPVAIEEIARWSGSVGYDTNGVWNPDVIEFDIKAMRKLRETDEIALAYIANNSGDIKLIGDIYLWFKE